MKLFAFRLAWLLVSLIALLPVLGVIVGLWPTVHISAEHLATFVTFNGLAQSITDSLLAAIVAPLVALYVAFIVYSQYRFNPRWQKLEKRLAPLLSLPHLAVALGLVYLFSSGGLVWSGLNAIFSADVFADIGLARKSLATFILSITLKEIPFFLFVFGAIGQQLPIKNALLQSRVLGYSESASWWLVIFPAVLKQSRLALLAAMAYTVSALDVSLLIGPNIPQLFAVQLHHWQTNFSQLDQAMAFLGNLTLLLMLVVLIGFIYLHQVMITRGLAYLSVVGSRMPLTKIGRVFVVWLSVFSGLSLAILMAFLFWSLGGDRQIQWGIEQLSFDLWQAEWFFVQQPLNNSLLIGFMSSVLGVGFALLALQLQRRSNQYFADYYWLLAILLPQLSMVYGWQIIHTRLSADYKVIWVVLAHLPFTFAYSYLVLRGPFQSLNSRFELVAASLGYSPWRRFWLVRFNLLRPALLSAWAIAFSVSVAQYISTLMIGAGRIPTISTEAVAIASGNEQSIIAVYMLVQSAMPFIAFIAASLLARRFKGSHHVAN